MAHTNFPLINRFNQGFSQDLIIINVYVYYLVKYNLLHGPLTFPSIKDS